MKTSVEVTKPVTTPPNSTPEANKVRAGSNKSVVASFSASRQRRAEKQKTGDALALSSESIDLAMLKAAIDELPEINASKVVDLHRRIVADDYEIDVNRLAESLLAFEKSLED